MCGIVGVYSRKGQVSGVGIERAVRALHHRGPDGSGRWLSQDGHVGLGHARLSIIDLETGSQPIANEDGSIHIVVNGEFYDHDRIRRELQTAGHKLRTSSDSEIALHLYEDLGMQCMQHLRGEFAFVLWDDRNKVLIAARDRFGIKPLNYAEIDGTLYFGSEIKALFAAGVPARWDHESVYQQMTFDSLADRTLFAGVHQVPPGYCLIASPGGTRLVRYWDFNYPAADAIPEKVDETECVERVREALLEAVRLRLRADVPVGCYLSGGIDSCAMLGMATHLLGAPPTAFTISFESERYDEAVIAQAMAKRVNAEFHTFEVPDAARAGHFRDAVMHNETVTMSQMVAKFLLSKYVHDLGYKVVLTGEGADEIFAGYTWFRWDKILGDTSLDADGQQALFGRIKAENGVLPAEYSNMDSPLFDTLRRRLGFVPAGFVRHATWRDQTLALLNPAFAAECRQRDPFSVYLDSIDFEQLRGRPRLHQSLYLHAKLTLPNAMLRGLGDRSEMAHSIEGRVPMLDHPLVELAASLPPSVKVRGVVEKHVLREAARPFVTREVFERRKHPFTAPISLSGQFGQMLQDTLRSSALDALPFFERKAIDRLFDDMQRDADQKKLMGRMMILGSIASLCVLQEGFNVSAS